MDSHTNINEWETYLRGLTPCHFPRFGRPNTDSDSARIESAPVQIDSAREDAALQQLSVDDVDGLGAVLAVAWALLLRCYTGQDDTCFAFEHAFAAVGHDDDGDRNGNRKGPQVARVAVADDAGTLAGVVERAKTELAGCWTRAPHRFVAAENSDLSMLDSAVVLWSSAGRSTPCPVLTPVSGSVPPTPCVSSRYRRICQHFSRFWYFWECCFFGRVLQRFFGRVAKCVQELAEQFHWECLGRRDSGPEKMVPVQLGFCPLPRAAALHGIAAREPVSDNGDDDGDGDN